MAKKRNKKISVDFGNQIMVDNYKPNEMLDEYFMTFELRTCKQLLWIFLREAMIGEFPENTTRMERDRIFHFYAYTVGLLEAMHLKYKKRQKKQKYRNSFLGRCRNTISIYSPLEKSGGLLFVDGK